MAKPKGMGTQTTTTPRHGFLVIPRGVASKEYADIKTRRPEQVESLVGKVSSVALPLGGRILKPATPLVSEGDDVSYGQKLGEPVDDGLSVGVWSSMDGTVTSIEDEVVAVSAGDTFVAQAESEAEAEAAR